MIPLSCRPYGSSSGLCVMETRAGIDPQPHVNYTPERCQPCLLFRYVCVCASVSVCLCVCVCVCVCPVNLISANREKWINNGKANTVADRRVKGEEGQRETDGEERGGVWRQRGQGGNQGNGERNEWREQRAEDTGQLGKL